MSGTAQDLLHRHQLTVADYHRMGEADILPEDSRVELIEGEIIDMSPIGSRHAGTVLQLSRILNLAAGRAALVSTQNPVVLGMHSEPEPDIMLLHSREDFYKSSHPQPGDILLIVEVAESSLNYDRQIKIPLYARHGIPEVWLVDIEAKQLCLFLRPGANAYQDVVNSAPLHAVTLTQLPEVQVDLSGLFI